MWQKNNGGQWTFGGKLILNNENYPVVTACRHETTNACPWPFNPNFPQASSFPAFKSAEWLALAWWGGCKGYVSKIKDADKISEGAKLDWRMIWGVIYTRNQAIPANVPGCFTDTKNYSLKNPGGWVETLLDADRFWLSEINGWALRMVCDEFHEIKGSPLAAWPFRNDDDCKHLCQRFHAYQQARYRWHEYLLEKHCERALGRAATCNPENAASARACLIGWLSTQRGFAKHRFVTEFTRRIPRPESKSERTMFDKERCAPSKRRSSEPAASPFRPDMMGWIILTWPIWNEYRWKCAQVAQGMIEKFEPVDQKGNALDFWPDTMPALDKALRVNLDQEATMPAQKALELIAGAFANPTPDEASFHNERKRTVANHRDDKNYESLCRRAIGEELSKQLLLRPRGRGTDKNPPLWSFALQISA